MKITSFDIRNFRTFDSLCLTDLQRVNLIAGQNNVGKTALLEALWQFSGPDNPGLGPRLNSMRGVTPIDKENLLLDLYHGFDTSHPIEFSASGDWGTEPRTLQIEKRLRETSRIGLAGGHKEREVSRSSVESDYEIVLCYNDGSEQTESRGWYFARPNPLGVVETGLEFSKDRDIEKPVCHIFSSRHRTPAEQDAEKLGQMEVEGKDDTITKALTQFEPNLQRLTTITKEGESSIFADLGMSRLVPTGLLGDGIQRMLSIALAFGTAPGGMALIDEIENGIHYSKLVKLWQAISLFSEEFDVQVFATTHSRGCVRAAHRVFSESDHYPFRYHRLDRVQGKICAKTFDQEMLDTAIQMNLEVR